MFGILLFTITIILIIFMLLLILWLIFSLMYDKHRENKYYARHVVYNTNEKEVEKFLNDRNA